MRAVWKGSVSFGLVNIPVALYPATRQETVRFRQLRKSDLSPIKYKRVAETDEKEVPWEEIVKGYEYAKDQFVVLTEEDFESVDVEATQTVNILDFVELDKVDPIFFQKPYYLEPQRGGEKAYVLLRDTLNETGKTGIAKVVIKTREYLAAVKPKDNLLVLELLHFADEIASADDLKIPSEAKVSRKELETAKSLVESLTVDWDPERYEDDYRVALMELIEKKIAGGEPVTVPTRKRAPTTEVVDLVKVLQESLSQAKKGEAKGKAKSQPAKAKTKKKPAAASAAASKARKRKTA